MLATLAVYALIPGEISINPITMGEPKLLVLGLGTTIGVVAQTLLLLPYMKRVGFNYRPLWGWDSRLSQAGGMALWVTGYVAVGQIGYVITTRVATAADAGSVVTYTNAWLLLQVPYGVLGVSLLTTLMPRLSRAAANADIRQLANDFSLGVRLSTLALVPVAAVMTAFGDVLGIALFSIGAGGGSGAERLGLTVAWSAFGILPYAVMMLQIRVFYAQGDSRTPTLIQLWLITLKVPLLLLCPMVLPSEQVVIGIAAVNSLSFHLGRHR
ncbi:lipid II flippase MurJ [Pseudonocardia sp. ICBG1142]|uniref:murein biosynthesis integral membrane protein MurJ n=1 Tax=Pseudonocardia sp. ICBG1142 TaxID=2846760 RepID=UPI0027E12241|nr:lipid II flippase MurJ [Pseudonocardia sp. ICBG1142]